MSTFKDISNEFTILADEVRSIPHLVPHMLDRASDTFIGLCQFNTPVKTGKLIQSYKRDPIAWNAVNVFNDAFYAVYVEFKHQRYMMTKAIDSFEDMDVMEQVYDEVVSGQSTAFDRFIGMEVDEDDYSTEDYSFIE